MMATALRDLREAGSPISTLYASTEFVYRKVGYEQAGTFQVFRVPGRMLRPGGRLI